MEPCPNCLVIAEIARSIFFVRASFDADFEGAAVVLAMLRRVFRGRGRVKAHLCRMAASGKRLVSRAGFVCCFPGILADGADKCCPTPNTKFRKPTTTPFESRPSPGAECPR